MFRKKIIGIFLLVIISFGCSETNESYYINIDAARREGALARGWIPNILPESSYDIYERHNLDTNRVWVRFKYDKNDIKSLINQIREIFTSEIDSINFIRPIGVSWWPKDLNKESFKDKQPNIKIYKYNNIITYSNKIQKMVQSFFVIDWNSNIAYYWQYES